MATDRPVLIFVHGTGDTMADLAPAGDLLAGEQVVPLKWWQIGSEFEGWLRSRLGTRGGAPLSEGAFLEFSWSGRNSERAREEAAKKLSTLSGELAESGCGLHYLAHSHGGNVVRRALELGARGKRPFIGSVRSVTAFGTPFFHYTISALMTPFLISAIALGPMLLIIGLLFRRLTLGLSEDMQTVVIYAALLMAGMALSTLFTFLTNAARLARYLPSSLRKFRDEIDFINFLTRRDEAISLLMSLNDHIVLMRRRIIGDEFHASPLGCGIQLSMLAIFLGVTVAIWSDSSEIALALVESRSSLDAFAIRGVISLVVGGLAAFFIGGILTLVIVLPLRAAGAFMDMMITARLKRIAFGSDAGNGLSSVDTCPWPGFEHVVRHVPAELEEQIERHIASNTTGLWGRLRLGLAPTTPLIQQDFPSVVAEALTWDELSHTVYYRVESFAELIANRLHATGDWTLAGPSHPGSAGSIR